MLFFFGSRETARKRNICLGPVRQQSRKMFLLNKRLNILQCGLPMVSCSTAITKQMSSNSRLTITFIFRLIPFSRDEPPYLHIHGLNSSSTVLLQICLNVGYFDENLVYKQKEAHTYEIQIIMYYL